MCSESNWCGAKVCFCQIWQQSVLPVVWFKSLFLPNLVALGPGHYRAELPELDSAEGPPCMWACCMLNHVQWVKRPPVAMVRKFGDDGASSAVGLCI
ncbi:hypothetical protein AVEN_152414-1 [Araneus ventricosus]|uniref:Uncharacterized protein n=1 Tax=Araneus ventricosus TaxID=182803 RepID=A0A4Y2G7W0_ARAVE|nr:hypothetical protein AVEN_152414-1 [Araneus ventricosus]